jgi:hypothetical protein
MHKPMITNDFMALIKIKARWKSLCIHFPKGGYPRLQTVSVDKIVSNRARMHASA